TGTTDQAVDWSMQETTAGGTIDGTGLYTAPSNPGTFHVVATSHADGKQHAIATVVVTASITIAISPASTSLTGGGKLQFHATVGGTSDASVIWSIQEGTSGGT